MGSAPSCIKASNAVKIGIIGVARISVNAIIAPANLLENVVVQAVASRSLDKAKDFAQKHNIPSFYGSYDELLDDPSIDAVYIPLPNSLHCDATIKALRKGKHVLCEKPFSSNAEEAQKMIDEAKASNKILVEAAHLRFHPLVIRLKEIVQSGEIGALKHVKATFCLASYASYFISETKPTDIRFQYDLAGGIMMDAGFYPTNIMRLLMGKEPTEVTSAVPKLESPDVDSAMHATFKFEDGSTGEIYCDFRYPSIIPFLAPVEAIGELGTLQCSNFIRPDLFHTITVTTQNGSRSEKVYGTGQTTYYYQLQAFAAHIQGGPSCTATAEDALKTMQVIDSVYLKAGMRLRGK